MKWDMKRWMKWRSMKWDMKQRLRNYLGHRLDAEHNGRRGRVQARTMDQIFSRLSPGLIQETAYHIYQPYFTNAPGLRWISGFDTAFAQMLSKIEPQGHA